MLFSFMSFVFFFLVIPLATVKFLFNYNHLLVSLLCLEFISLSFFVGVSLNLDYYGLDLVFMLYFLVMVVCEGVLGLCLLILLSFFYGSDYLFLYNKLLC